MDNYYTERPIIIIDLGRMASIGGIVIRTWQGKTRSGKKNNQNYSIILIYLASFFTVRVFFTI
jgi:hypothetical protein